MNKKVNTLLFIVAASIFNVVMMIVFITAGLLLSGLMLPQTIGAGAAQVVFLLLFAGSVAGSFFVYHRAVRFLLKKIDMDAYFHPIFKPRRKP